jgi:hypothetical protein
MPEFDAYLMIIDGGLKIGNLKEQHGLIVSGWAAGSPLKFPRRDEARELHRWRDATDLNYRQGRQRAAAKASANRFA